MNEAALVAGPPEITAGEVTVSQLGLSRGAGD
jgi:hypothetical protein